MGYADQGNYALAYLCRAEGTPAVIIADALGVPTLESGGWWGIVAETAPLTRNCVYDRAGLVMSGQAPEGPGTSQSAVRNLRVLLAAVPVPGPYVLVRHAVGGYHTLLFASQYPDEVAAVQTGQFRAWRISPSRPTPFNGTPPNVHATVGRELEILIGPTPPARARALAVARGVVVIGALIRAPPSS